MKDAGSTLSGEARRDATADVQPRSVIRTKREGAGAIDTDLLNLGDRRIHEPQRLAVSRNGMVATAHDGATAAGGACPHDWLACQGDSIISGRAHPDHRRSAVRGQADRKGRQDHNGGVGPGSGAAI